MQANLIHKDKNLPSEMIKSFEDGIVLNTSYNQMGVASSVMLGMDCASLYNHIATCRKQSSFASQSVISKATTHSHMSTHAY
jgi:hypothetical protein